MDGNVLPKGGRKITHMVDLEYRDGVLMKCVHVLDVEVDPDTGCENRVFVGDVWMPVSGEVIHGYVPPPVYGPPPEEPLDVQIQRIKNKLEWPQAGDLSEELHAEFKDFVEKIRARNYDQRLYELAKIKGWKIPITGTSTFPARSWNAYWAQCEEYERNPDSGRPVPPHRSA